MSRRVPFKPGKSGNPGGRPKGLALAAREGFNNLNGIGILVQIACGNNPKTTNADRIAALDRLMDRGWGKAIGLEAQFLLDSRNGGEEQYQLVRSALDTLARALGTEPVNALPDPETIEGELVADSSASAVPSAVVDTDPDAK